MESVMKLPRRKFLAGGAALTASAALGLGAVMCGRLRLRKG